MFGCCGFLSFSLIFCLLGGRLGTTLYIHFIWRWVETRRHSSVSRRKKRERKGGKVRHSSQCRAPGLGGVCGVYQQASPVDRLRLAYDWTSPSGGGRIPPLRRYVSVSGAAYDLHCAYLGEPTPLRSRVRRSRPTPYACTSVRLPPPPACP